MIYKEQLKELINRTLLGIDLRSEDAVNLLLGTAAQESHLGYYIRQLGNAPALGIFQMEPLTFKDHIENFLEYKPDLKHKIRSFTGVEDFKPEYLEWNLAFACAMSRVHYLRVREALPTSIDGYATYWKKYYNTHLGKGTTIEFINNYKKYVL